MRQSVLLLDDNRDISEDCITRPLVEIGQLHVFSHFSYGVDFVYFVLAYKKLNLGKALLFQVNFPLLKHIVDKNR